LPQIPGRRDIPGKSMEVPPLDAVYEWDNDRHRRGATSMAGATHGAIQRDIDRIFNHGSVTGLAEGQLLRRVPTASAEIAFEALVPRHGPMVLGVCRRLLYDPRDVEDAFQATFLVLLRRAAALREADALSPWLHGVAYRVAARIRAGAARRPLAERKGA